MDQTEGGGLEFFGDVNDFMVAKEYVSDIKFYTREGWILKILSKRNLPIDL